MADNSNYLSTPSEYATPSQIKSTQDYAKALMYGNLQQPVHHWTQGLSNMVGALVGGNLDYNAGQRERASQMYEANTKADTLNGTGAFPPNGPPVAQAPFRTSPAEAGSTNTPEGSPVAKMAAVTAGQESGGNYQAIGPETRDGDRAYGKYQVMGKNVPEWTQQVLGKPMAPADFLNSPEAQEVVYKTKMGEYAQKYGPEGASRAWFAGEGGMNNTNATAHKPDGTPYGPTVGQYGKNFALAFDGSQGGASQAPAVQAIQTAAAKGGTPMPFQTQQPQAGATGQIYIDPSLVRPKTNINHDQLATLIGNNYIGGTATGNAAYDAAIAQGQPIAVPYMDGAVLVDPRNPTHQQYMPNVHWGESQIGDIKRPIALIPDGRGGLIQAPVMHPPTPGAAGPRNDAGPAATPTAAPGEAPPVQAGNGPAVAQNAPAAPTGAPNAPVQVASMDPTAGIAAAGGKPQVAPPVPDSVIQATQAAQKAQAATPFGRFAANTAAPPGIDPEDWAAYTQKKAFDVGQNVNEDSQKKAADFAAKKYDTLSTQAQAARTQAPNLDLALAMMNDPNIHQGLLHGVQDTWSRFKAAALGDKYANAPNETFDKLMSGAILGNMKTALGGLGQVRLAEINLLTKANANRNNTDASNRAVLEVSRRSIQTLDHLDQIGQQYASGDEVDDPITGDVLMKPNIGPDGEITPRHGLDSGYDKLARKYVVDHPSFTPEEIKNYQSIFDTGRAPGEAQTPNEQGKGTQVAPSLEETQPGMTYKGYVFKGGDKHDQNNWEKSK
jgi:hypothetical protein